MIVVVIYIDRREDFYKENLNFYRLISDGIYGYFFILAWVVFVFIFVSGFMYLILRKRK